MQGDRNIESAVEFARGRVEIRTYHWQRDWNGLPRARPDMYIFELNLSPHRRVPSSCDGDAAPGSFEGGDVAFIPPHSRVLRNITSGRRRALLCMFERASLDSLMAQMAHQGTDGLVKSSPLARSEWLLRNIYQEMREGENLGCAIVVESFANALAVELARRIFVSCNEKKPRKGGIAPWRMRLLRERIHAAIAAPSLADLADLAGMTVRHLCRAFKVETGVTPGRYINAARAEQARTLLARTDLSLSEIAHRLGFATSASFSSAFQRATGLKPRQIERSHTQDLR
jgi:AraC family transcriptional regulator